MIKKTLITLSFIPLLVLPLSGCSTSLKQTLETAGSFTGASYARNTGENVLLGAIAGGLIGNLAGQMITQARPY